MDPFIGEVRLFGGNFAPLSWAFCDGSQIGISQNDALYSLIGTTYGGDGVNTFNLPDLRGRVPLHKSPAHPIGQMAGVETVTLTTAQIPAHTHFMMAGTAATTGVAVNNFFGSGQSIFYNQGSPVPLNANAGGDFGGGQPHDNVQAIQCVTFIIALEGIYPSQN